MKEFHVLFVPRKSHLCEKKLKELGVYGSFKNNLKEFFLDLIPLDYDLLSMENPDLFRDSFLYSDSTYLYHIAKSIMTMQILYGIIPNIYGKGKMAKVCLYTHIYIFISLIVKLTNIILDSGRSVASNEARNVTESRASNNA